MREGRPDGQQQQSDKMFHAASVPQSATVIGSPSSQNPVGPPGICKPTPPSPLRGSRLSRR